MLFVHPKRDGKFDLDEFLGAELVEELAELELERCVLHDDTVFDEPINWKLGNDAFCEPYHFSVLHGSNVAALIHGDVTDYEEFGRHHRMTVPSKTIEHMGTLPESEWNLPTAAVTAYYLFPSVHPIFQHNNLVLTFIYPDPADPTDPSRNRTRLKIYDASHIMKGATEADHNALNSDNMYDPDHKKPFVLDVAGAKLNYINTTIEEDYWVGAHIQNAAQSGQLETVTYGRNEIGLQHVHRVFRETLGMPPLETLEEV
jgi:choline monooxygenase